MDLMTLYFMAEEMSISYVTAVVITGLSVVFLGLIILILFVWAFGKVFSAKSQKSDSKAPQENPSEKPTDLPEISTSANEDNQDEIIAVISAAVAAMGQESGKNYKIKSVRAVKNKPSRSAWSLAGIQNDTSPF